MQFLFCHRQEYTVIVPTVHQIHCKNVSRTQMNKSLISCLSVMTPFSFHCLAQHHILMWLTQSETLFLAKEFVRGSKYKNVRCEIRSWRSGHSVNSITQSTLEWERNCGLGEQSEWGKRRKWSSVEISSLINALSQLSLPSKNKLHHNKLQKKRYKRNYKPKGNQQIRNSESWSPGALYVGVFLLCEWQWISLALKCSVSESTSLQLVESKAKHWTAPLPIPICSTLHLEVTII